MIDVLLTVTALRGRRVESADGLLPIRRTRRAGENAARLTSRYRAYVKTLCQGESDGRPTGSVGPDAPRAGITRTAPHQVVRPVASESGLGGVVQSLSGGPLRPPAFCGPG